MKRITVYHQFKPSMARLLPDDTITPLWENNLSSVDYVNGSGIVSCVGNAQSFASYEEAKRHIIMMSNNGLIPNELTLFDENNVAWHETEYEIVQFALENG